METPYEISFDYLMHFNNFAAVELEWASEVFHRQASEVSRRNFEIHKHFKQLVGIYRIMSEQMGRMDYLEVILGSFEIYANDLEQRVATLDAKAPEINGTVIVKLKKRQEMFQTFFDFIQKVHQIQMEASQEISNAVDIMNEYNNLMSIFDSNIKVMAIIDNNLKCMVKKIAENYNVTMEECFKNK